jgi:hypothetical protein
VGRSVTVRIREFTPSGSKVRESASQPLKLTTSFQPVQVIATMQNAGDAFDIRVSAAGTVAGDAYDVDLVTLQATS